MDHQVLDLVTKIYLEMQEMKSDMADMMSDIQMIKSDMLSMKSDLLDMKCHVSELHTCVNMTSEEVNALTTSQTKMEHQLTGKMDVLFDTREDQIDVDEKVAFNLQKVEHKLDKLELKLMKNIFSSK